MTTLFPYQRTGAAYLAERRHAMLLDEQGLGKTAQAIEACNLTGARDVLVVCPASVRTSWRREFERFGTGQRVTVESYDMVTRRWRDYDGPWDVAIFDEAHYLKSSNANRTRCLYGDGETFPGIAKMCGAAWPLTGTPAPNNPAELYSHLAAFRPDLIRHRNSNEVMNRFAFQGRYCRIKETKYGRQVVGGKNLDDLREKMAEWTLRRLKKDVLPDLPELLYEELPIDADAAHDALKDIPGEEMDLIRDVLRDGDAASLQSVAAHLASLRRVTATAKAPVLAEWVHEFLDATDRKIVIFAHHVEPLKHLWHLLRYTVNGKRIQPAIISGETAPAKRQAAVDRFQSDPDVRVFLGQIQAAGTGLTLTAASDMVFLEQSWVPAENAQAAMRIHRIGQKRGCVVRYMTLTGSIDEAVQRTLARKTRDLSQLFD